MKIDVKYNVGDTVWVAADEVVTKQRTCPDCNGTKKWLVHTPSSEEFQVDCQTCRRGWTSTGVLSYSERIALPWEGTIGSVRIDTNAKTAPVNYMLNETGVGSGTIWPEDRLYSSEEEAQAAAEALVAVWAAEERQTREQQAKNSRSSFYVQARATRLRKELMMVGQLLMGLLTTDQIGAEDPLYKRAWRAWKRNENFTE